MMPQPCCEASITRRPIRSGTEERLRPLLFVALGCRHPGGLTMDLGEKFNSYRQQCQHMARATRDPDSKATWTSMAERWGRLAERYRLEMTTKKPRPTSRRRSDRVQRLRAA
jgi:hypothetical protein